MKTIYDNTNIYDLSEEELDYVENYAFDDELANLKVETEGQIIAIASMGLWNGRKQGYKLGTRMLSDVLTIGNEDNIVLYYDGFNVRKTAHHHDGTNYFEVRNLCFDDYNKIEWWDDDKDGNVFDFIKKHAKPISWEMIGQGAF